MVDPVVIGKVPGGTVGEILIILVEGATTETLDVLDTILEAVPVWAELALGVLELIRLVAVELVKVPTLVGLDVLAFPLSVSTTAEFWELNWVVVMLPGN